MNYTLHLTNDCNLRCSYCFVRHGSEKMTVETARAAYELAVSQSVKKSGFAFFGGEPLLCRDVIEYVLGLCDTCAKPLEFTFKMTTNGLLLDESFMRLAAGYKFEVTLSHDGLTHDDCRRYPDGRGSLAEVDGRIDLLLKYQPRSAVMMTVDPHAAASFAESVEYFYRRGLRKVYACVNCSPDAGWSEADFSVLREQYLRAADFCAQTFERGDPLSLPSVDQKISEYILSVSNKCSRCDLGVRQPSVSPAGVIYPCVQFVGRDEYRIGDVFSGTDAEALNRIRALEKKPVTSCSGCALEERCKHSCACLNLQQTGATDTVSPVQCASERVLIEAADRLAGALYKAKNRAFLTKYYSGLDTDDGFVV